MSEINKVICRYFQFWLFMKEKVARK